MIKYIQGDLLQTDAPLILHQVNLQGVMGGGLAYSIAQKYPSVERKYRYFCGELGDVLFCRTKDFVVGNCYSQNEDFTTNYDALAECFLEVREYMVRRRISTVALPYKYGCGIARGDWATVEDIITKVLDAFDDLNVLIYKLGD